MFLLLIGAYGVCFGLQNRVKFLHNKIEFIDNMLACSYCTGFHSGWITYLIYRWHDLDKLEQMSGEVIVFAFASSAFCYMMDSITQLIESKL